MDTKRALEILIQEAVNSFGNEHPLSDWERGQMDGLRWAKQLLEMLEEEKNPPSD